MNKSAIYHISDHVYAYPIASDVLSIRLKTAKDDIDRVIIHYKNIYDHDEPFEYQAMERRLLDEFNDYYESEIKVEGKRFKYYFELHKNGERQYYTADGFLTQIGHFNAFFYPYVNADDLFTLPQWIQGEVVYQVFVDRFYRGKDSPALGHHVSRTTRPDRNTLYGGDLYGVIDKLDYLLDVGVRAIYLNPVFSSPSYHKYDIADYDVVEAAFGGEEGLKKLVQESHQRGIGVILDGVFNHCAFTHKWFQDVLKNGEKSRYADWFLVSSYPVSRSEANYDSFGGVVPSMPKFNTANPEVIDALTDIAVSWTKKLDIDGWRLDVADEVSHTFWKVFRAKVKVVKPDCVIIGEVWNHASRWLQGDEMDTVTNYKFREWALRFAKGLIPSDVFWSKIHANLALYKRPLYPYLVNVIGSHDTERSRTHLGDDALHRLVMALMITFEGIPLIYYGDEVGMKGGEDPDNRRAMQWDLVDSQLAKDIRTLSRYRQQSRVLKHGGTKPIIVDDRVLAFERSDDDERLYVFLNFSDKPVVYDLATPVVNVVDQTPQTPSKIVSIPPMDYRLVG